MSKTSITGRKRRAVTKIHRVCYGRAIRALVGVSAIGAIVGVGVLVVPGSDAAATKQAKAAAVDCSTFGHSGIPGVVMNETGSSIKRTFVEHGPGTGFFKPEPPAEVPAKTVSRWCVGSNFGVEAMQVDYELPNGEKAHFLAYFRAVVGGLETSCSMSNARGAYGCAAEDLGPGFVCSPYVGCVGLRDPGKMDGARVVFRVFPR